MNSRTHQCRHAAVALAIGTLILGSATAVLASSATGERADVLQVRAPSAPASQSATSVLKKSDGCMTCHRGIASPSMHSNPAVMLGCTDCHGGNAKITRPTDAVGEPRFDEAKKAAHVLPWYPERWHYPSSANPKQSYTLLNDEAPEYVRFINPGDYRVAREACGSCHLKVIEAAETSLMSTGAMLFGGASYNNGILPFKRYLLGEAYTREGEPAAIRTIRPPLKLDANMTAKGILPELWPLPPWEHTPPGDVFRVFERGGRNLANLFPDTGLPNATGLIQRLEEPGRPDIRQSNRGPGTGNRIAVPLLNIHKTRLNDPLAWFLGTNEQPGDYRSSGCSACHVVYANDRDPRHSGPYAVHGNTGKPNIADSSIPATESGHPLSHGFTRAIPTSQCMVCHMHQPNMFVNSFLGYTMWDYESDAPHMWPEQQRYPSAAEIREINDRNPEEAAIRGKWSDPDFLKDVSKMNPELDDTQFADYHGHGWNFRAVFKRDRDGTLLDAAGDAVDDDDPEKFKKAVHMSSTHLDAGMHCVDCHFAQDSHGNGHIYGEVAQAVEIECIDCHGSADRYPTLRTSGPAAPPGGNDLSLLRVSDGRLRFEWVGDKLMQRSSLDPDLEWDVSLVRNSVTADHAEFNPDAARAKLVVKGDPDGSNWALGGADRAHQDDEMMCITCHTSWTTSCAGCHLPIQSNFKTERHHYEGGETRNFATYNPQVARDQMYMLGRHGEVKGGRIAPVRSSSALVLSSRNANRELLYIQQPPVSASGFSSQAFAPHFPHTVRKTETKACEDCHLSKDNDNNAILAQLFTLGTRFVNFIGHYAWVGQSDQLAAVQVTEWDEPQAVLGSYLHKYAYPDWYAEHIERDRTLLTAHTHDAGDEVECLQTRGEYLFVAQGARGMQVYDIANVANKGFSQRIVTAPFGPLGRDGHDTRIRSRDASCVALPTNQPIAPPRNTGDLMRITNQEQPFHPIYNFAMISDRKEGLIIVNVNTLQDGEPRNNQLRRALTWNPDGILDGARHITLAGYYAYIAADAGLIVINLDNPLKPQLAAVVPVADARSSEVQFRYLFLTSEVGMQVVDITQPEKPALVDGAVVALDNARGIYVARTYAYIAADKDGLVIIDVEQPERPVLVEKFNAGGLINEARDVVLGSTNASLFAYVADGKNGLRVLQLTSPDTQPKFYGFSPRPVPQLIASYPTKSPALSLSVGIDRDRAVDETGNQMAVFGRIGSRPLSLDDMQRFYLDRSGKPWFVSNELP